MPRSIPPLISRSMSPLPLIAKALSYGSRARATIFVALLAVMLFTLPDQTLELYVIYAQGLVGLAAEHRAGTALAEAQDAWLVVQLGCGLVAVVLLSALMWAATVRVLSVTDRAADIPTRVPRLRHEVTASIIGIVPAAAVAIGFRHALDKLGVGDQGAAALLAEGWWLSAAATVLSGLVLLNSVLYVFLLRQRALPLIALLFSRRVVLVFFGLLALGIAALVRQPIAVPATVGALAIAALFLATLTYLLTVFGCFTARNNVPVVTPLLLLAVLFAWGGRNDNHRVRHELRTASYPELEPAFLEWYRTRKDRAWYADRGLPYPVYIISAEGGGLYAAYHAASFLASVQDDCPAFAHHTFAISSVSGGSLGAAVFSLAAGRTSRSVGVRPCGSTGFGPGAGANTRLVRRFFANDFLSPLVAAGLFPDFLQRFLPWAIGAFDRARALESTFVAAWDDAVEMLPSDPAGSPAVNEFERPIADVGGRGSDAVPLFLNTTAVATGARVTLAPYHFEVTPTAFHVQSSLGAPVDIPLAVAVSLSARFPLVTPVGWLERPAPVRSVDGALNVERSAYGNRLYLADGGYFENSGLETAVELATRLRRVIERHPELFPNGVASAEIKVVKIMAGDKFALRWWSPDADMSHASPGEVLSPLAVLLNTRRARTRSVDTRTLFDANLYRYSQIYRDPRFSEFQVVDGGPVGYVPGYYRVMLDGTSFFLPLGWHLSASTRRNIDQHGHYISAFSRCMIRHDLTPSIMPIAERVKGCAAQLPAIGAAGPP